MLIECSNITKSFQGLTLLKDITFKIDDHDKIAVIGVNNNDNFENIYVI